MNEWLMIGGIAAALMVGIVSPGPSFILVAQTALTKTRQHGLTCALGMGLGGLLFAALALAGLHTLLTAVPTLYLALKVLGGLYLCYLGYQIFAHAKSGLQVAQADGQAAAHGSTFKSFVIGLTTQVSNPKTAIVYASIFAAFLPKAYTATFVVGLLITVFILEAGWYALVAYVLSSPRPQRIYLTYKTALDRIAGTVMCGLGLRLVYSAVDAK